MPIIEKNNKKICYETKGCKDDPYLILVMGITGQLVSWPEQFIDSLAGAGFQVITFDNRDVGLSSYYDELGVPNVHEFLNSLRQGEQVAPPYTLADMAEDILLLMDELQIDKAHFAGISMGGQIAQVFALEHPERMLSLILISTTSGDRGLPSPKQEVLDFFFKPKTGNDLDSAINRHVEQYKIYCHPDDFDAAKVRSNCEKIYARAYHPEGNTRQMLANIAAPPREMLLEKLELPTLIIHGDYDPVFLLEHGQSLHNLIKDSELVVVNNMGHILVDKYIATIVQAISKLKVKDNG